MIRSKEVADYFEVDLAEIRPGTPLTFDLHLFFPRNRHMMIWRRAGEAPTPDFIAKYMSRGVDKVYVHKQDEEPFNRYYRPDLYADPESAPPAPQPPETPVVLEQGPRTEAGAYMADVIQSDQMDSEQKTAVLSEAAQAVLGEVTQAESVPEQQRADTQMRRTIQDVLDVTVGRTEAVVNEIWKLCKVDPELEHAVSVATYAVVFAMAFGRIDPELIADIAMAGLLHDVGLSQVPFHVTSQPWRLMNTDARRLYSRHVEQSISIVEKYLPQIPQRVKTLIRQHHEKFDGTGFPQGLKGFNVDDIAQIVAMADLFDAVASGQWDGQLRTMKQTLQTLEQIERSKTFPEHFNPEVFSAVIRWTRNNPAAESSMTRVVQVVGSRAKELAKG